MRKITKLSLAAAVIGIGTLIISYIGGPSYAANIDNTPDCDNVAIFYCGAMNEGEFHRKWNNDGKYKDHHTVFAAFGINKNDVNGMVDGIVWKDGRVTLGNDHNNVVATNAMTAGRNWGTNRTPIAGTNNAAKFGTRDFATEGQTAMLKIVNGEFKFAVIKSCGNPVSANPKPQPKPEPKPQPKPESKKIQVCELSSQKVITIREDQFNSSKHSKDLKDCEPKHIKVCELETSKIITINERDFDRSKHSKDLDDCKPKVVVKDIKVCDIETMKIITIKEDEFDSKRHSTDLKDCEKMIEVCDLETEKIIEIREKDFDREKHSKDIKDCQPKKIKVCELATKEIVYIDKKDFDREKHSKNLEDCESKVPEVIKVCLVDKKEIIEINKDEFNKTIHSKDLTKCEPEPEPEVPVTPVTPEAPSAPAELPQTGVDGILNIIGLASLAGTTIAYFVSRRHSLIG